MPIGNGNLSLVRRDAIPKGLYVVDPVLDGHVIESRWRKRRCSARGKKRHSQVVRGPRPFGLTSWRSERAGRRPVRCNAVLPAPTDRSSAVDLFAGYQLSGVIIVKCGSNLFQD